MKQRLRGSVKIFCHNVETRIGQYRNPQRILGKRKILQGGFKIPRHGTFRPSTVARLWRDRRRR